MKDKTCRTGVWESKDTVDLQRASPQPTAFFPIVLTAFLQPSMCVVFGYYWYIQLGVGGLGQGGREMGGIILVKIWGLIGEMVKQ